MEQHITQHQLRVHILPPPLQPLPQVVQLLLVSLDGAPRVRHRAPCPPHRSTVYCAYLTHERSLLLAYRMYTVYTGRRSRSKPEMLPRVSGQSNPLKGSWEAAAREITNSSAPFIVLWRVMKGDL